MKTYSIGERVPVVVTRTEANFDRACDMAFDLALLRLGHDENGDFEAIPDFDPDKHRLQVQFASYAHSGPCRTGRNHIYRFEVFAEPVERGQGEQ